MGGLALRYLRALPSWRIVICWLTHHDWQAEYSAAEFSPWVSFVTGWRCPRCKTRRQRRQWFEGHSRV